jgi:hypothetical protein
MTSERHGDFTPVTLGTEFLGDVQVLPDGILDVRQSFLLGQALGCATWQARNPDAVALFGLLQRNEVVRFHAAVLVEAARVALPYGIENKQVADSKFRFGCQNRYIRHLSLLKTYVACSGSARNLTSRIASGDWTLQ